MGAEPMSATRRSRGSRARQAQAANGTARLTSRGAIAILFIVSLLGIVISHLFDQDWAAGLVFVIGCAAASLWVRPSDTPMLVVAPPIAYFAALLVVEIVTGLMSGMFLQVTAIGIALNLSTVLFWLLGGTALAVVILLFRGLPDAWADLRAGLRGEREADEPAPYGAAPGPPPPRRPAPPYPANQPTQVQPRPAPGVGAVPPRPQRPQRPAQQWNAPRPDGPPPPRGYQPRRGGYPPQPGGGYR